MFNSSGGLSPSAYIDNEITRLLNRIEQVRRLRNSILHKFVLDKLDYDVKNVKVGISIEIPAKRAEVISKLDKYDLELYRVENLLKTYNKTH